jgi:hypothetical protein
MKKGKHYVNSNELEGWWDKWNKTKEEDAWNEMSTRIYKICCGIATKFNPKSEEEHMEHVHDAWQQTMEKIKNGKLKFEAGRAPVFNLITTTVFRILYSKMNKQKKQREHHKKYAYQFVQKHMPELLSTMEYPTSSSQENAQDKDFDAPQKKSGGFSPSLYAPTVFKPTNP